MLCPRCGRDVGDQVGLCQPCQAATRTTSATARLYANAPKRPSAEPQHLGKSRTSLSLRPYEPAELWKRGLAIWTDVVIGMIFLSPLAACPFVGFGLAALAEAPPEANPAQIYLSMLLSLEYLIPAAGYTFFTWLYLTLSEGSRFSATPGKLLFSLRVTNLDHRALGFIRAALRSAVRVVPFFLVYFAVVPLLIIAPPGIGAFLAGAIFPISCLYLIADCAPALFTSQKQALHDLLARTRVVTTKPLSALGCVKRILVVILLSLAAFGAYAAAEYLYYQSFPLKIRVQGLIFSTEQPGTSGPSLSIFKRKPSKSSNPINITIKLDNKASRAGLPLVQNTPEPSKAVPTTKKGTLGYVEFEESTVHVHDALILRRVEHNTVEIGLFDDRVSTKAKSTVFRQGDFASLRKETPVVTITINFGEKGAPITNDNLQHFTMSFNRRAFKVFSLGSRPDVVSFDRSKLEKEPLLKVNLKVHKEKRRRSLEFRSAGSVTHSRTKKNYRWSLDFRKLMISKRLNSGQS